MMYAVGTDLRPVWLLPRLAPLSTPVGEKHIYMNRAVRLSKAVKIPSRNTSEKEDVSYIKLVR
jgi:hypothetical protein